MKRLVIWRGERLDRHVTQKQSMYGFCFYPRINICAFADWRSDLRYDALFFLNKSSESTYVFPVKY